MFSCSCRNTNHHLLCWSIPQCKLESVVEIGNKVVNWWKVGGLEETPQHTCCHWALFLWPSSSGNILLHSCWLQNWNFFLSIFMITFCGTWMHPKRVNSEGVKNVFECVIASCPPSVGVGPAALISLIFLWLLRQEDYPKHTSILLLRSKNHSQHSHLVWHMDSLIHAQQVAIVRYLQVLWRSAHKWSCSALVGSGFPEPPACACRIVLMLAHCGCF